MCNIAREMGKFDMGMRPLLSFYADHYYRTYVEIVPGTKACDDMLAHLGYMRYDQKTLERDCVYEYDRDHRLGPFWLGPLFDKDLLGKMSSEGMAKQKKCDKMLDIWRNEIDSTPFVYDVSELSSFTKLSPPNMDVFIEKMNEVGPTSKTHFSPTSFVTELPLKDILEIYRENGNETPRD